MERPPVDAMPMFPLGSVLLPGALLPLQVFEARYLSLLDRVMSREPHEFGVVLIERGSEVGGGDARTDVGCVARVVRASPSGGGRWSLVARGDRRLRVMEWLPDAPHPMARVQDWPDDDDDLADLDPAGAPTLTRCVALMRRALALCAELGVPAAPATVEVSDDPATCVFQLAALAPLGPADHQRILAAPSYPERLTLLEELLADAIVLLDGQLRITGG